METNNVTNEATAHTLQILLNHPHRRTVTGMDGPLDLGEYTPIGFARHPEAPDREFVVATNGGGCWWLFSLSAWARQMKPVEVPAVEVPAVEVPDRGRAGHVNEGSGV